jgi:mannosyltransferase OCH1-like enzyme
MIPRLLHYVWVGGSLPEKQRHYVASWTEQNPDFKVICWNEDNIDFSIPAIREAHRQRRWSKVADIVRLVALQRHGGIYLDTDFQVYRPLDPVLQHRCFFGFQTISQSADWVSNAVIGAEPSHWFIEEAVDRVLALRPVPFGLERPTRTGPKLVTRLLRSHGLQTYDASGVHVRDVFLYPRTTFFPYSWTEEFTDACVGPDTLAVHFWEKSWAADVPVPIRVAQRLKARLLGLNH